MQQYGPLTERQAALIIYEALQTLRACHENRIYHGDVKPANFMLEADLPDQLHGALERYFFSTANCLHCVTSVHVCIG